MANLVNARNTRLSSDPVRITGAAVSINAGTLTSVIFPKNQNPTLPVPATSTLTALATGYITPQYSWSYRFGTTDTFTTLSSTTSTQDFVFDNAFYVLAETQPDSAKTLVQFKVRVTETASNIGINATEYILSIPILREATNYAKVTLYRRTTTATAPSIAKTGDFTYTFNTASIVGQPSGWLKSIPDESGGAYLWVVEAAVAALEQAKSFANSLWSDPVLYTRSGATGTPGTSTALVYAYKRSVAQPADNPGDTVFDFSTGKITTATLANSWEKTIPSNSQDGKSLWVTVASASNNTTQDTIAAAEWGTPVKFVENGLNTATVFLYARNNSTTTGPAVPTTGSTTYTFSTALLSSTSPDVLPSGWSQTLPLESAGSVLWVIQATASSTASTDTIANTEWSAPRVLSAKGSNGDPGSPGSPGVRGTKQLYSASTSYNSTYKYNASTDAGPASYAMKATDLIAAAASGSIPTTPLQGDTVTFSNNVTSTYTGTISDYVLTVSSVTSGTVQVGQTLSGTGILTGTTVVAFVPNSGTNGGIAQYTLSRAQTVSTATAITATLGDYVYTITYDGTGWKTPGTVIDGSLLVTGSITASKINSNGLSIKDASGNVILAAGSALDWKSYVGGAGKPQDYANNTYVQSGIIYGVSSGSGTQVDNTYTTIGQNLIPNSDGTSGSPWKGYYNPAGDKITKANVYTGDMATAWSWNTGNYVLPGNTTKNYFWRQEGLLAGGEDVIAIDVYPHASWSANLGYPVIAGQKYIFSCFVAAHNCKTELIVTFWNSAGNSLGYYSSGAYAPTQNTANNLALYNRESLAQVAPANAVTATVAVRKYNGTVTDTWMWLAAPMFEAVNPNVTQPSPYTPGPAGRIYDVGVNEYRVVARGNTATTQPADSALWYNGEEVSGRQRSYILHRISRQTGKVVYTQSYDVFGNGADTSGRGAQALADDLNNSGSDVVVVVRTHDEPQWGRTTALFNAMYRCGASPAVFGSQNFRYRSAYVLIGIGGCGTGNGAEMYQGDIDNDPNAWVDLTFQVANGNLIGVSSATTPRTLSDYGYVGDKDATKGADSSNLKVGVGVNLIPNADFLNGSLESWSPGAWYSDWNISAGLGGWELAGDESTAYIHQPNANTSQTGSDLYAKQVPVVGGKRYEAFAYTGAHRANHDIIVAWYRADGSYITENVVGSNNQEASGGTALSGYKKTGGFATAPSDAAKGMFFLRKYTTQYGGDSWAFMSRAFFGEALPGQTELSPWSPGPVQGVRALGYSGDLNATYGATSAQVDTINSKLNKSGNDIMSGQVQLTSNYAMWFGDSGTAGGDTGVYIGNTGIVGKKAGATTFALDNAGNATFGGSLSAATGSFAGSLSAATGTFSGTLTANAIAAVNTINIAGQAVTIPTSVYTDASIYLTGSTSGVTIQSLSFTSSGGPVYLAYDFLVSASGLNSNTVTVTMQLKRGTTIIRSLVVANSSYINSYISGAFTDTPGATAVTYQVVLLVQSNNLGSASASKRSLFTLETKR